MRRFLRISVVVFLLTAARGESVVVLPFHTRIAGSQWIGEALAEGLTESLHAAGLLAVDRSSRNEAYRRQALRPGCELTKASALGIAESLDAAAVITGSFDFEVRTAGGGPALVVRAQVLDRLKLKQSPVLLLEARLEDLSGLQRLLAWQVLRFFDVPVPQQQEYTSRFRPVRTEAIENHVRGLLAEDAALKQRYFAEAVRLDPAYSPPQLQLGKLHWSRREYGQAAEWLAKAAASDVRRLEALFFLGVCRFHLGEYERAAEAFKLVAESVPLNEVWNNLGVAQSRLGRPEALESLGRALAGDSADADYNFNTGYVLWKLGRFAEAADRFRAALASVPEDRQAISMLGRCLKRSGPSKRDASALALERLKVNYDELAYRQLRAISGEPKSVREP